MKKVGAFVIVMVLMMLAICVMAWRVSAEPNIDSLLIKSDILIQRAVFEAELPLKNIQGRIWIAMMEMDSCTRMLALAKDNYFMAVVRQKQAERKLARLQQKRDSIAIISNRR